MNPALKVVMQLPLTELWRDNGFVTTSRIRFLTAEDISSLLRAGPVQFVVADVGSPARWVPLGECYEFWKAELKARLAAPESQASSDNFPDGCFYFASQWNSDNETRPIIVCEKHH